MSERSESVGRYRNIEQPIAYDKVGDVTVPITSQAGTFVLLIFAFPILAMIVAGIGYWIGHFIPRELWNGETGNYGGVFAYASQLIWPALIFWRLLR